MKNLSWHYRDVVYFLNFSASLCHCIPPQLVLRCVVGEWAPENLDLFDVVNMPYKEVRPSNQTVLK